MSNLMPPDETPSPLEHPLVQAVRGEIPVVRPLTEYWVATVRSRRERRLYQFLREVAQAIEDLRKAQRATLDVDHIAGEDFDETLASTAEVAVRDQDEAKRKYLRQFVVNYGTTRRPDITLRRVFFQFISELSGLHLVLLDKVYAAQRSLSDRDLVVLGQQLDRSEALSLQSLARSLNADESLLSVLGASLESKALVTLVPPPDRADDPSNRVIMRPLARRFMAYLQEEPD